MVAIGRALMANPQLLLCDEISFALAPVIIKRDLRSTRPLIGTIVFVLIARIFRRSRSLVFAFAGSVCDLSIIVTLTMPKGIAGLLAERFDLELFPPRRRVRLPKQKSDHLTHSALADAAEYSP